METLFIGKNTIFLPETDSTNSYAMGLLKNVNLPEGTVVHAAVQHAGKGQRGTSWKADPQRNLTVSVLLKPVFLGIKNSFLLYQVAALSCFDTLAQFLDNGQFDIKIKWPNDILVNGKKIAGILIENTVSGDEIRNSIIGFGINLNQESFGEIGNATSYRMLTGEDLPPRKALGALCSSLEKNYLLLRENKHDQLRDRYLSVLYGLDCTLPFAMGDVVRHLRVRGVHRNGLLNLEDEQGGLLQVDVKEVRWLSLAAGSEGNVF